MNDKPTGGVQVDEHDDKEEVKTKGLKEILTSLLLIEEQAKTDNNEWEQAQEEEKNLFEENHRKKTKTMLDYQTEFHESDHVLEETHRVRKRKSRASTNAAITSVIAADLEATSAQKGSGTGLGQGAAGPNPGPQRRLWVKNRSQDWWDKCNSPDFPDEEFKKWFRMGKDTFEMICNELTSVVAKENTMLRDAVPVRQRVAVCIWRLATGEPLRLVSRRFGLGISTCHKLVLEVCSAIKNVLMPKYLQWPDDES
ncbi:Harbinger transposase-derived nuclease [Artemisia annua]|uniref:Harbinger transposase-derived nuclease n=1 Tax=Artemisia annua TaxID=35608 RepID=A0A2U1PGB1_ARTAN|nr:Harbinger transposase-derived nuclease [Artemisia annua]